MAKSSDVPGNAFAAQAMFDREMLRLGTALHQLEYGVTKGFEGWGELKALRFRPPGAGSSEWLAVVTAHAEGEDVVAFHSADTLVECIGGVSSRLRNGSLKWKADQYA